MYRHVPRSDIAGALKQIRELFRRIKPPDERALRAQERLEATVQDLLSNLPRTNQHPTLKTILNIAETCNLTLDGAHRLFGYDLEKIRIYDLLLNGARTHVIESYSFQRELPIDLPLRIAEHETFAGDALLRDLVSEWQTDLPIKVLDSEAWSQPGAFYVHVGTEDSVGSPIPPGSMALVEPVAREEALRPRPRSIYLLQFGNGYRCSHCVATGSKLRLFTPRGMYVGREEFQYPGEVRIAGRIRMFALDLPVPEYRGLGPLPESRNGADLILPWEHRSRDQLLATKHRRFRRSKEQERFIHDILEKELHSQLSGRSERRYRRPTSSEPHVNVLIHLSVAHVARYTDALRTGGFLRSDKGRFSLESLLNAHRIEDLLDRPSSAQPPVPADVWSGLRDTWGEWPPLLSMKFPNLQKWDERIVRLAEGYAIDGLDLSIRPGSCVVLDSAPPTPNMRSDVTKTGWSRPLYVLRKGVKTFCGYLDRNGNQYALHTVAGGDAQIFFRVDELRSLRRVVGIAVPL